MPETKEYPEPGFISRPQATRAAILAARTFIQTALAVVVAVSTGFLDGEVWKAAAVAGGAASLSAIQAYLRKIWGSEAG